MWCGYWYDKVKFIIQQSLSLIFSSPWYIAASRATHTHCERERKKALASGRIAFFEFPSTPPYKVPVWYQNGEIRFWLKKMYCFVALFFSAIDYKPGMTILNFIFGVFARRRPLKDRYKGKVVRFLSACSISDKVWCKHALNESLAHEVELISASCSCYKYRILFLPKSIQQNYRRSVP